MPALAHKILNKIFKMALLVDTLPQELLVVIYGEQQVPLRQLLAHRAACKLLNRLLPAAVLRIELNYRRIGAAGAAALATLVSTCTALKHLNLGRNGIVAEGAASLAVALPQCASLQHLNLEGNDI